MNTLIRSGSSSATLLRAIPAAHPSGPSHVLALSGGIGAGKSTLAHALRGLGAHIVDADALAREVLSPEHPVYEAVLASFGNDLVGAGGVLDRQLLAQRAFSSPEGTALLNSLTHPAIAVLAHERLAQAGDGKLAVYDVPLLTRREDAAAFDGVIMVSAPMDVRLERLEKRGVGREEAAVRISRQISDEQRRELASIWVDNSGSKEDLTDLTRSFVARWLSPSGI
ncbi:dephospho-CoA kinase [Actinomyces sp.]